MHLIHTALFFLLLALSFLPWVSATIALAAGIVFSLSLGNPYQEKTSSWSKKLLQLSVVGLGFGIEFSKALEQGWQSIPYTIVTILFALLLGALLGKILNIGSNISQLISFGTAICGGSAIAALAPTIKAKQEDIAIALAIVFSLNAVALFIFPTIGQYFGMSQESFGLWAALGIHDTSSVVAAASTYGTAALETAITVKLTRALWIAPFILLISLFQGADRKIQVPLFIIGFIIASALRSITPQYQVFWDSIYAISRQLLVVTLFLIGASVSRKILKQVGTKPLVHAVILWVALGATTLIAVISGVIH